MGLLSKLFGNDKEAEKAAKDIVNGLNDLFGSAAAQGGQKPAQQQSYQPEQRSYTAPVQEQPVYGEGPSGDSWGPNMPAEPNQYNYSGTFEQYFDSIFYSEFAGYRIEKEHVNLGKLRIIYAFYGAAGKALVVEIMPSSSSSKKIRSDCQKTGIPYLRYYYDYDGWWNTRSYVTRRTRDALSWG